MNTNSFSKLLKTQPNKNSQTYYEQKSQTPVNYKNRPGDHFKPGFKKDKDNQENDSYCIGFDNIHQIIKACIPPHAFV